MGNIYHILQTLSTIKRPSVLATIIKVEGSAYRKEGATMLFMDNDQQIGTLSAGCLEEDLKIRAYKLLGDNQTHFEKAVYDMSAEDDLSWGRGAGCNGVVHILLEKVDNEFREQLGILQKYLDDQIPVAALRKTEGMFIKRVFVTRDFQIFGNKPSMADNIIKDNWDTVLLQQKNCQINQHTFIQYFKPQPRLYIFGAGPDARPLASIAERVGFKVYIWDWRPSYLMREYYLKATFIKDPFLTGLKKEVQFNSNDSIVIMTHDFQKDQKILQGLMKQCHVAYLGILGPRKRTMRLLKSNHVPEFLHSPIGLSIGAEGPEEIAISIVADLIKAQRKNHTQKGGVPLVEKKDNRYLFSSGEK